jgi:hypothetical protein
MDSTRLHGHCQQKILLSAAACTSPVSVNINALAASFLLSYSIVPRIRLHVVAEQLLLSSLSWRRADARSRRHQSDWCGSRERRQGRKGMVMIHDDVYVVVRCDSLPWCFLKIPSAILPKFCTRIRIPLLSFASFNLIILQFMLFFWTSTILSQLSELSLFFLW